MAYTITDILNEPCLNEPEHSLKAMFDSIESIDANVIVKSFGVADINKANNSTSNAWLNLCRKILNPLKTCSFEMRPDYDELLVLPFCCKLEDFSGQTYGINIYNKFNRLITVLFGDSSRNNTATMYTHNTEEPVANGTWSSVVKPALKAINATGLNLINADVKIASTPVVRSILNTYYRGNTITVTDLVDYINRIKTIYDKTPSIR